MPKGTGKREASVAESSARDDVKILLHRLTDTTSHLLDKEGE